SGMVVVPLYVDDNPDNIAWCAGNAEVQLLVVESTHLAQALEDTRAPLPPIRVLHPDADDRRASVAALLPETAPAPEFLALPDDAMATICYTSGTSGRPKGVVLSHGNIIANVTSCQQTRMARSSDVFLSILPLSHMFERTGGYYLPLSIGAKVTYARSISQLAEDLAGERPTVMFAVPRVFEKFAARLNEALAKSPAKKRFFDLVVAAGGRALRREAGLADRIVLALLRDRVAGPVLARLGGRMRFAVLGGAPLDPAIAWVFLGP